MEVIELGGAGFVVWDFKLVEWIKTWTVPVHWVGEKVRACASQHLAGDSRATARNLLEKFMIRLNFFKQYTPNHGLDAKKLYSTVRLDRMPI